MAKRDVSGEKNSGRGGFFYRAPLSRAPRGREKQASSAGRLGVASAVSGAWHRTPGRETEAGKDGREGKRAAERRAATPEGKAGRSVRGPCRCVRRKGLGKGAVYAFDRGAQEKGVRGFYREIAGTPGASKKGSVIAGGYYIFSVISKYYWRTFSHYGASCLNGVENV